jgi:uncharacterized protein HI_1038
MYLRTQYLNKLISFRDTDFIKIVTGVRRSGKSVLLKQYKEYLESENVPSDHIVYLNLEAYAYRNVQSKEDLGTLLERLCPDDGNTFYLLIDEVQYVDSWQKVINGFRVSYNCDIVLTGSNARLLSGELASLLSGRYVEIPVYPFSFHEFLEAKGIPLNTRETDIAYKEYEKYGGLPGVILSNEELKSGILSGIYDSILLNDIASRGNVRDTFALKRIVSFLADNAGQMISSTKISNLLSHEKLSISYHTVGKYLDLLQEAFLFYEAMPYDLRGKAYLRQNAKYFMVDHGLRNIAVGFQEGNYGNRLENIVFMELLRRGYTVDVGRLEEKEIDFIARKNGSVEYYQVCYRLPSNTHETDNLLQIPDNRRKVLITGRYEDSGNVEGIELLYIVDWLLTENK